MPAIIFAIDNDTDPMQVARFERHLMSLQALGKLTQPARFCIGMWQGKLERSYCLNLDDFNNDALQIGSFTAHQQAVLIASTSESIILHNDVGGNRAEVLPPGVCVGKAMPQTEGWTYFHDTKDFWVIPPAEGVSRLPEPSIAPTHAADIVEVH